MDASSGAAGFMMGLMMGREGQSRPATYGFVAIRFEKDFDLLSTLKEVIEYAFRNTPPKPEERVMLEFSNKFELKLFPESKKWGDKPIITFPMCFLYQSAKDFFFCIALRNEIGSPIPLNMVLFRHLLINLDAKKVKYELW
jgi:hypothetical protein